MENLPAAALPPDDSPTFAGGFRLPGTAAGAVAAPPAFVPPAAPLLTVEQLREHLQTRQPWCSLPDGRALRLTPCAMEFLVDDWGGHDSTSLRSAHRVLWFATRSKAQLKALWFPMVPANEDPERRPGLAFEQAALQADISEWAFDLYDPAGHKEIMRLAHLVWTVCIERLPVSAEKKSPGGAAEDSASHTSVTSAGWCPETFTVGSMPGSTPPPPSSFQSSSPGATSTDSESSRRPKKPDDGKRSSRSTKR